MDPVRAGPFAAGRRCHCDARKGRRSAQGGRGAQNGREPRRGHQGLRELPGCPEDLKRGTRRSLEGLSRGQGRRGPEGGTGEIPGRGGRTERQGGGCPGRVCLRL
ncbi:MAG: hypothetical protein DPW14_04400 [Planctomycetes bacterium]|nr:hypothetical protein [Planctomycetota bacterium]